MRCVSCARVLQMLRDRGELPTAKCGRSRYTTACRHRNVHSIRACRPHALEQAFPKSHAAFPTGARMKTTRLALLLVATSVAVGACNAPDSNRTTKAPPGVDKPTAVVEPLVSKSAPPAPTDYRAPPPNANDAAPGTDASKSAAVTSASPPAAAVSPQSTPGTAAAGVAAQQAAAEAPDTASADAAKAATAQAGSASGTARDTAANAPRTGTLTKEEESSQMPKAGQANNHSSPALEADSGRSPKQ